MKILIDSLHNLTQIECNFALLAKEGIPWHSIPDLDVFDQFCQRFGSKILSLDVRCDSQQLSRIKTFENLKDIKISPYFYLWDLYGFPLNNLEKVAFNQLNDDFKTFVTQFKRLKCLAIWYLVDANDVNILFNELLKLKHLIDLDIEVYADDSRGLINKRFEEISYNSNLKSINCGYFGVDSDFLEIDVILDPFIRFKHLERLDLCIEFSIDTNDETIKLFSLKSFDGLKGLTHLNLDFGPNFIFENTILTGIDIILPNLRYFKFKNKIFCSQWTADILSRFSRLESIKLDVINQSIRPIIEDRIRKNCKKVRQIDLSIEY